MQCAATLCSIHVALAAILHNFGRLAGRWNEQRAGVDFTRLGRWLRAVMPVGITGHMLCYVVERAQQPPPADRDTTPARIGATGSGPIQGDAPR